MRIPIKKQLRLISIICVGLLIFGNPSWLLGIDNKRPNLIFILADDCTYKDLELYGGQAKTPFMNQLSKEGMKFSRVYQSAAMCSPTRHALYTGLHPVKSGAYPNHANAYSHVKSVAHYLSDLDYRVILAGKQHIGPDSVFPFEHFDEFAEPEKSDVVPVNGWRYPQIFNALESTKEASPVCMFLCSNEPHGPYNKGDASKYPKSQVKMSPQLLDTHFEAYCKYLAEITYFDGQVGEIMEMLKTLDLEDNTLLIVSTEQGSAFPYGKWTCYEMGVASGMVARWPGKIARGSQANSIVEYVDIVPTFIDVAGGKSKDGLDGRSIKPMLLGQKIEPKKFAYSEHTTLAVNGAKDPYGIRTVVNNRYRYIRNLFPENNFSIPSSRRAVKAAQRQGPDAVSFIKKYMKRPAHELYDIIQDPYCENNLAENPEYNKIMKSLSLELDDWMQSQGDKGRQTELEAMDHVAQWLKQKLNKN